MAPFGPRDSTLRAFLIAPLVAFVVIYIGTAAYLRFARLLVAPAAWVIGACFGLPVLYTATLLIAMPLHRLFQWRNRTGIAYYVLAGIFTSAVATWIWSEVIRLGPIPLFRDFPRTIMLTMPAGAAGGAMFWRMAARSSK